MNACLIQGSAEWLALRKTKITSTDASIIMGVNPWKTPYILYQQKLDLLPPEEENEAMKWGKDNEEEARQYLENLTSLAFFPDVVFHPEYDFMMASLDGITLDKQHICELKCPRSYKPDIPEYYYVQMQHHLVCSQAKSCYYLSYFERSGEYIEVYPNKEYIDSLILKEKEFYQCLISKIPPPLTEKDFAMRSDDIWIQKSNQWIQAKNDLALAEKREKELRDELINLSGRSNTMGAGIKLSKSIRRGSVEYQAIPELSGINLDMYRKSDIEVFRIDCL